MFLSFFSKRKYECKFYEFVNFLRNTAIIYIFLFPFHVKCHKTDVYFLSVILIDRPFNKFHFNYDHRLYGFKIRIKIVDISEQRETEKWHQNISQWYKITVS